MSLEIAVPMAEYIREEAVRVFTEKIIKTKVPGHSVRSTLVQQDFVREYRSIRPDTRSYDDNALRLLLNSA